MSTIGSQIGLGASMVGVSTAIGKAIAKSGLPPLQKAVIIAGGSLIGGYGHSIFSAINRNSANIENKSINSNISKFIDDSSLSPLETRIYDIQGISITCLGLLFILTIQIGFKLYLKENIKLNLGIKLNNTLWYYRNKRINLNKKMSVIYIYNIGYINNRIVFIGLC